MKTIFGPVVGLSLLILLLSGNSGVSQIRSDDQVPDTMKAVIGLNLDLQQLGQSKLGKAALAGIPADSGMPFEISDLTKISALVGAPAGVDPESLESMNFYVYLGFKDPAVVAKVKEDSLNEGGEMKDVGGRMLMDPSDNEFPPGVWLDFRTSSIVIATQDYMTSPSNQFASQNLAAAYGKAPRSAIRLVVDLDGARDVIKQVTPMLAEMGGPMAKPYVDMIEDVSSLSLTSDIGKNNIMRLAVNGVDADANKSIQTKLNTLVQLVKGLAQMAPKGPEAEMMKAVDNLEVSTANGASVINMDKPAGFDDMVISAVNQAQKAALVMTDQNNFKQMALGLMNYHVSFNKFPFDKNVAGEDSGSGLNWKVFILQFIEQNNLYEAFAKDESFDSETNAKLADIVVPVFQLNTGGRISWVRPAKVANSMREILDGTSNTISLVQDRRETTDPWTKPSSISPAEVLKQFNALKADETMIVALYDGSVRTLTPNDSVEDVMAMLEPADGKGPSAKSDFGGGESIPDRPQPGGDDPFGGDSSKSSDDPFGGDSGKSSDDPFGGESSKSSDDPFGGDSSKSSDDPFGGESSKSSDDPFGK